MGTAEENISFPHRKEQLMEKFQKAADNLEKDYQIFLDYLVTNEVRISKATEHIGKKDCFNLNSQFCIVNEKYKGVGRTQEYYAVIDFFVFFSVKGGILRYAQKRGAGPAYEKGDNYDSFFRMSSLERYILMLGVWLGDYWRVLEENHSLVGGFGLFRALKDTETGHPVKNINGMDREVWGMFYIPQIRLYALFGLLTIKWLEEDPGNPDNKFLIKEICQTEAGACFTRLMNKYGGDYWFHPNEDMISAVLEGILPISTPETEEKIRRFLEVSVEAGEHAIEFLIKLGSIVRKIKTGDQHTLEDLHFEILDSVGFDRDHLYYFQFGSGTLRRRYYAPECAENDLPADEILLAELSPYEGMGFEYLYDFGDMWHFQVLVKHICPGHMDGSEITAVKGENPEQYPTYGEEDW